MKNIKLIALLVCLSVIVCTFAGCAKTALLTFELNDGTYDGELPTLYSDDEALALPTPTRQYYSFKGWALDEYGSGELYTEIPAGFELSGEQVPSEDTFTALYENITGTAPYTLTFYAIWERLSGTITYDLDGGRFIPGKPVPTTYLYGEVVELPIPELEHYEFVAWVTPDGEKIDELEEDQEGPVSLVASWLQVETPITFVLGIDGATLNAPEIFSTEMGIENLMDSEYIPVADGAFFIGWYADAELTVAINSIPATTEAQTIYAKWEKAPTVEGDNWVGAQ